MICIGPRRNTGSESCMYVHTRLGAPPPPSRHRSSHYRHWVASATTSSPSTGHVWCCHNQRSIQRTWKTWRQGSRRVSCPVPSGSRQTAHVAPGAGSSPRASPLPPAPPTSAAAAAAAAAPAGDRGALPPPLPTASATGATGSCDSTLRGTPIGAAGRRPPAPPPTPPPPPWRGCCPRAPATGGPRSCCPRPVASGGPRREPRRSPPPPPRGGRPPAGGGARRHSVAAPPIDGRTVPAGSVA